MSSPEKKSSVARFCACNSQESSYKILCGYCVKRAIRPAQERRQRALMEWNRVRNELATKITTNIDNQASNPSISEYPHRTAILRQTLEKLQQENAKWARQVTAAAIENEQRHVALQNTQNYHDIHRRLETFQSSFIESLQKSAYQSAQRVRRMRFAYAAKAFDMHRIQIQDHEKQASSKHPRGIGTIHGLPLPHAGPDLYSVLPQKELLSALRLVASCTHMMAICLSISLPHPILLHPLQTKNYAEDSLFRNNASDPALVTLDRKTVQQRIRYATQIVQIEDPVQQQTDTGRGSLEGNIELLQNNVTFLCLRTMDQSDDAVKLLWPPEALLWNLYQLFRYCRSQAGGTPL